MMTRQEDYVVPPVKGYSNSLSKREYIATCLAAGLLAKMPMGSDVMRAAVILADDLIKALNEIPIGSNEKLPDQSFYKQVK